MPEVPTEAVETPDDEHVKASASSVLQEGVEGGSQVRVLSACFGSRMSEVQILSPRPIFPKNSAIVGDSLSESAFVCPTMWPGVGGGGSTLLGISRV